MYVGRSKSCTHYQKFANMSLRKQVFIFGFPKKEVLGVDPLLQPWNMTTLSYRHWFWILNFSSYIVPLQHFIKLFISLQNKIISHEFWKKLWTYSEIFDGFDGTVYIENECFHVVCQIHSHFLGLSLFIHFNILTG